METRIGSSQPATAVPATGANDRDARRERRFVLPRAGDDVRDEETYAEDAHVLAPRPRRGAGDKPVSRARLDDEAGHRIDFRG
ncbi:MAG: hypothetical protein AAGB93_22635 [Planctomycetota bacterium]